MAKKGATKNRGKRKPKSERKRAKAKNDVDAVGISIMSGAHMTLMPKIVDLIRDQGQQEVVVFGGGVSMIGGGPT